MNASLWLLTKWFKRFVKIKNLDINYYSLRNINYWFYIFSARYLESEYEPGEQNDADLIFLDVLCKTEVVYSGFLHDFNYSPHKDQLENIVLTNVNKRNVDKSADGKEIVLGKSCKISGEFFMILAQEIVNINICYTSVPEETFATEDMEVQTSS